MLGAGIFALMGEAAVVAGNAVYLSFLAGGGIALLSGYSLGRLGARYPSAGGMVEYLVQAFGAGTFSGGMSIVLYTAAVISLALVAQAFGSYASALISPHPPKILANGLAVAVVVLFTAVNLRGSRDVAKVENIIVAIKLGLLVAFAAAGLAFVKPSFLSPSQYVPVTSIVASVGITFFAYEGFRVITNTAEDMADPGRTLPRAIITAVLIVMALYIVLAIAVLGSQPVAKVIQARDYALAEAARPAFGALGFTIVGITALISTASAINAGLYAATNVTYQLAKDGELPAAFGWPIAHSTDGLLVSAGLIIALIFAFSLGQIAVIGSITVLTVHTTVHVGHLLRLRRETGASTALIALAAVANTLAIIFVVSFEMRRTPLVIVYTAAFLLVSFATEIVLQWARKRRIIPRVTGGS